MPTFISTKQNKFKVKGNYFFPNSDDLDKWLQICGFISRQKKLAAGQRIIRRKTCCSLWTNVFPSSLKIKKKTFSHKIGKFKKSWSAFFPTFRKAFGLRVEQIKALLRAKRQKARKWTIRAPLWKYFREGKVVKVRSMSPGFSSQKVHGFEILIKTRNT